MQNYCVSQESIGYIGIFLHVVFLDKLEDAAIHHQYVVLISSVV